MIEGMRINCLQLLYLRNKMIESIEKHGVNWHMVINGIPVIFTRFCDIYTDKLTPFPANTDNGLRWRINRKWASYKQIKKAIYELQKV